MPSLGYHCSHEQLAPSELLSNVAAAQAAGFDCAMCSDHFAPWSLAQGNSGFAWSWLGAALERTQLGFGTVSAPGQRYHPAIIAQAAGTLAQMYPGRFWLALGTGEALNEHITGTPWPDKATRRARLLEVVQVIRALFAGEEVTHNGLVRVHQAKLYSLPEQPPPLYGAAVSEATAEWVGGWADGLITIARPQSELQRVVEAFRRGGGENKPMLLQSAICYARTESEALQQAYESWRTNVIPSPEFNADVPLPEYFDAAASFVRQDDLPKGIRISSDLGRHKAWIEADRELGFERIYLHQVSKRQDIFLEAFAANVL